MCNQTKCSEKLKNVLPTQEHGAKMYDRKQDTVCVHVKDLR